MLAETVVLAMLTAGVYLHVGRMLSGLLGRVVLAMLTAGMYLPFHRLIAPQSVTITRATYISLFSGFRRKMSVALFSRGRCY